MELQSSYDVDFGENEIFCDDGAGSLYVIP